MAVFGVPVAHEDDALRACRAAVEMRDALPELGLDARIGVNTGEVVTGTAERLATGDAVNVAARLEQAAPPGSILIGEDTHDLVRGGVEVEPVEALALKGKSAPVEAFRLRSVLAELERSHASRFVGRERELAALADAWARAVAQSRCELVTVVGEPGVGKSRLVAEAARLDRSARGSKPLPTLRGRDHVLAGDRSGEAARSAAVGSCGRRCAPVVARRERAGHERGSDRLGVPEAARGAGAARGLPRRHPVGRGDVPRPGRGDGAALGGSADPAPLHGAPGAARAPPGLAWGHASGAAERRRGRRADPWRGGQGSQRADRARCRRESALHLGDAGDGTRAGRHRGAADAEGVARSAARPARRAGAKRARARLDRRRAVPSRVGAGARAGGGAGHGAPDLAREARSRPS